MKTAKDIAGMLANRAESVTAHLLPNGKRNGHYWIAGSVDGEAGESLRVCLKGSKAGIWADFACDSDRGDLLDLWRATRGLSLIDAMREASQFLGIEAPTFQASGEKPRANLTAPKSAVKAQQAEPVMSWLTDIRAIPPDTVAAYRVAAVPGAAAFPAFSPDDSIQYMKYRSVSAKKFWSEPGGKPCLFGWQAIPEGTREVVITEGELDALAWHAYGFPALSPTNGAGALNWIETEFDELTRFDVIYLSFDADSEGQKAALEISRRLGAERCRVVELPFKDANECRMEDVGDAVMAEAVRESRSIDPKELVPALDFAEKVVSLLENPQECGILWPWKKCSDEIRFRPGEVSVIAGVNGHGKSQITGHVMLGALEQEQRACVASLEFKPEHWLARLAKQAAGMESPSPDYIRAVHQWYQDRLWVFDATGTATADRILEVFQYAARRYGIQWFVIDNLAKCGFGEDDYNSQKAFVDALTDFAREYEVHVQLCVHMRKGETEDRPAGKMDIKGTGAIADMVNTVLLVWRNKPKERDRREAQMNGTFFDESEHPDAIFRCLKQRENGKEPSIGLWFEPGSCQFLEYQRARPRPFVHFTKM